MVNHSLNHCLTAIFSIDCPQHYHQLSPTVVAATIDTCCGDINHDYPLCDALTTIKNAIVKRHQPSWYWLRVRDNNGAKTVLPIACCSWYLWRLTNIIISHPSSTFHKRDHCPQTIPKLKWECSWLDSPSCHVQCEAEHNGLSNEIAYQCG